MTSWYVRIRGRVLGPFDLGQLHDMRDKGQLQPFYEVSADRATWQSAGTVDGLFPPTGIVRRPTAEPPPAAVPVAAPPPPKSGGGLAIVLVIGGVLGLIAVLAVVAVVLVVVLGGKSKPTGPETAAVSSNPQVILFGPDTQPADRHYKLKSAVGLVVCGWKVIRADGTRVELAFSTGTCFAVTPDGYLITNRHVIAGVDNERRSQKLRDLEEKIGAKITPTAWVFFSRVDKFVAEIRYVSENYDLAVLKVDRPALFHFALSAKPVAEVVPDLSVSVWGFPGMQREIAKTIGAKEINEKAGPVEGKFREEDFVPNQEKGQVTTEPYVFQDKKVVSELRSPLCIQHTAEIFGGNSGGPLLLPDGAVIGINTYGGSLSKDKESKKLNLSITMPQLREEIDRNVPGVVWR